MEEMLKTQITQETLADPIKITQAEPWQWEILAEAFLNDPTLNFWLGEKTSMASLCEFFEAVIKDTLDSGGAVFSSPDQKVVIVWTRHEYTYLESPGKWKQRWYEILDPEGVKRYKWTYATGDVEIDPSRIRNSMLPDYIGVKSGTQGRGYGSHILKWTLNYFDQLGFESPYLLASTRRSAKLYGPLMGIRKY